MLESITLRVLDDPASSRPRCGICEGPSAIELRGYTYCLHCTDAALERADIASSRVNRAMVATDGKEKRHA